MTKSFCDKCGAQGASNALNKGFAEFKIKGTGFFARLGLSHPQVYNELCGQCMVGLLREALQ